MVVHLKAPSIIQAAGNKPKIIEEFIGLRNSKSREVSIARMKSPAGWIEPGQTPDFEEYTIVLTGSVTVRTKDGATEVGAGEAIIVQRGEWVQYSTPKPGGAEYISVCLPAFSLSGVHRDPDIR